MEWKGRRQSANVEDRRGRPSRGAVAGTGGLALLAIVAVVLADTETIRAEIFESQLSRTYTPSTPISS